jgi:hypothetical protein
MVITRTATPQTSCDRDDDDSNTSDHDCVSCHSYHLMAVAVTMSKSGMTTMAPMMGEQQDNINQDKAHRDHDDINTSDCDCLS